MTAVQAFILGVLQGVSEFLPISSSGHLVLLQRLFGITEGSMSFSIVVHLGSLAALIVIMRKEIFGYLRHPLGRVPRMVIAATIPTIIIVLIFGRLFSDLFDSGASLGAGFIFTALLLLYAESRKSNKNGMGGEGSWVSVGKPAQNALEDKITLKGALIAGVAQGIAVTPAISRSGSTIAAGMISGFGRKAAVEFAFLLSIPVILLAAAQDVLKMIAGGDAASSISAGPLEMAVGLVASAVTGYFAARFMLTKIHKFNLKWFSLYTGVLGALILADQLFFGLVMDKLF